MTELKFSGPATVTGFPRDKAFGFEIEGDRLILKAGKEIFLTVEKALATTEPEVSLFEDPKPQDGAVPRTLFNTVETQPIQGVPNQPSEAATSTGRKPRSPNIVIDDNAILVIDINRTNPYRGLRAKYYETLKTAHGRTVAWWRATSMVGNLEGNPMAMLKFFLSESVVQLQPGQAAEGPLKANVTPIQPGSFPNPQASGVAGPIWAGGVTPGQGGGATFL